MHDMRNVFSFFFFYFYAFPKPLAQEGKRRTH